MSVKPKLQEAIEEFQKLQFARRKARMAFELGDGHATYIDSVGNTVGNHSGQIILQNHNGNLELYVGLSSFPCNKIKWYDCINTTITFVLEGLFAAEKVILIVNSLDQVNRIIAHVKPPPKPRVLTYEHDGNITSSGSESEDSTRSRTTTDLVNNSFESDDPSSPESL